MAKMGEREWYFFSLRDRKYPTGLRTNRATTAGYWKATGKDKEVYGGGSASGSGSGPLLGMKKTLVFYKGRAPRGVKTKWVMHEYRLEGDLSIRHRCKEEWVICRVFNKTGEKKSIGIQGQTHLPPLLEAPVTQNPFLADNGNLHENEIKTLIDPVVSQLSMIFSLQENFSVPKQFKIESDLSNKGQITGTVVNSNLNWMDRINEQDSFQIPLFSEADYSLLGLSSSPVLASGEDDDVSIALNRAGFHMTLDSPMRLPAGESWPFIP